MKTLIALLLSCIVSAAATYTAATTALSDVQAAIALASTGDTVNIPTGSSTWTSQLILTKAITLSGAGTNSTIITTSVSNALKVKLAADAAFRITGISFIGNGNTLVALNGSGSSDGGSAMTQARVDHCKFSTGSRALQPRGYCYGVADHNTFYNCNIAIGPVGDNTTAWARSATPGTANSFFIENNAFVMDNSVSSEPNQQVYHQEGARTVTRFNTFDGTAMTARNSFFYDSHGNWSNGGGVVNPDSAAALNARGQPILEVYGNTFAMHHSYGGFFDSIRGGSMLIFSNVCTAVTSASYFIRFTDEESWQTALFSPLRTVWPAVDQVTNTFVWSNTGAGAALGISFTSAGTDATFIQLNRDYWLVAPSGANGNPTGIYSTYTPYTYPHPLTVTTSTTPVVPAPANPTRRNISATEVKSITDALAMLNPVPTNAFWKWLVDAKSVLGNIYWPSVQMTQ